MASGSWAQIEVKCPFYRSDDGKKHIICEGVTDASNLTWGFKRKKDYEIQIQVFCQQKYHNCEVFQMLMNKYKE